MHDLNWLIPVNSGRELQAAVAINLAGQTVGTGSTNSQQWAFLVTPKCFVLIRCCTARPADLYSFTLYCSVV
jgi:hypothetical protein